MANHSSVEQLIHNLLQTAMAHGPNTGFEMTIRGVIGEDEVPMLTTVNLRTRSLDSTPRHVDRRILNRPRDRMREVNHTTSTGVVGSVSAPIERERYGRPPISAPISTMPTRPRRSDDIQHETWEEVVPPVSSDSDTEDVDPVISSKET